MERIVSCDDDQEEDHYMLEPTAEVTEILKIVQVPRLAVYLHQRSLLSERYEAVFSHVALNARN